MDFDNRKVYGDTSITDGLVLSCVPGDVLDYVLDYVSASKVGNRELFPFGYSDFKKKT